MSYGAPGGGYGGYNYAPGMAPGMGPPGMGPPGMGPPGMGPPGMGAPGMGGAPRMSNGPPGMPSASPALGVQPAQVMPTIPGVDFSKKSFRFGFSEEQANGTGAADRAAGSGDVSGGAGQRGGRTADRITREALHPPGRAETARTIYIGGLSPDMPDDNTVEHILSCCGRLQSWLRMVDVNNKPTEFGFAEFKDVESLEAASEVLADIELPIVKGKNSIVHAQVDDTEKRYKKIEVVVDEASKDYIKEWQPGRNESDDTRENRLRAVRETVEEAITQIANGVAHAANANGVKQDLQDGDVDMENGHAVNGDAQDEDDAAIINIDIKVEDDLADIPEDMRASVRQEIKNFRSASVRHDIARARAEQAREDAERRRYDQESLLDRFDAPSGPSGGANGVPMGPRAGTGMHGAPSGPKGFRQTETDPANQVVNGKCRLPIGPGGELVDVDLREHDDVDESDEEVEKRRKKKEQDELEKQFLEQEKRWIGREKTRRNAKQRNREGEDRAQDEMKSRKETMAEHLLNYNDDKEEDKATRKPRDGDLFFVDPAEWTRARTAFRAREIREDDRDRMQEEREQEQERRAAQDAERKAAELEAAKPAPMQFSMKIGGNRNAAPAAAPATARVNPLDRSAGELLDDDDDRRGPRRMRRLPAELETATYVAPRFDGDAAVTEDPREKERILTARNVLARELPTLSDPDFVKNMFAYDIPWRFLTLAIVDGHITPIIKKNVLTTIGVEDDFIVDLLVDGIKKGVKAGGMDVKEILDPVKEVLEDDAEPFMAKIWRLVAFHAEAERRNITDY